MKDAVASSLGRGDFSLCKRRVDIMLEWIIIIVMAIVIGSIGNAIVSYQMPGGFIGSMIAGFAGAWVGSKLLGTWGPVLGGFAVIPAIIGAIVFVFCIGLISKAMRKMG
jgi:uncharacterized membrane protein YeaQ/YmgE (transglycosylase-associated protein family)